MRCIVRINYGQEHRPVFEEVRDEPRHWAEAQIQGLDQAGHPQERDRYDMSAPNVPRVQFLLLILVTL